MKAKNYHCRSKWMAAIFLLLIVVFAGSTFASAASVKLSKKKLTLFVGKAYTLSVSGTSKKVKWSSSKKSVATVTSKGKIKAKKKGTAVITAKIGKKKLKCKVTVKQPVKKIKLNKTTITLKKKGASYQLKATALPKTANNRKVTWTSSNNAVARVSSKGVVTAIGNGTSKIIATAKDGSGTEMMCLVHVTGVPGTTGSSGSTSGASSGSSGSTGNAGSTGGSSSGSSGSTGGTSSGNIGNGGNTSPGGSGSSGGGSSTGGGGSTGTTTPVTKKEYIHGLDGIDYEIIDWSEFSSSISVSGGSIKTSDIVTATKISPAAVTVFADSSIVIVSAVSTSYPNGDECLSIYIEGIEAGSTTVHIYDKNGLVKDIAVTVTSTDSRFVSYNTWRKNIENEIWTDSMSAYEKLDAMKAYIKSNFYYSASYCGRYAFMDQGCGDCTASTDVMVDTAHDLGLNAQKYYTGYLLHVIARVIIDGKTYDFDATC